MLIERSPRIRVYSSPRQADARGMWLHLFYRRMRDSVGWATWRGPAVRHDQVV